MTNQIFGHGRLRDLDTEHLQFTMDARRAVAGAPQPILLRDITRMSSRTSGSIAGRPPWRRRDFHVQYSRNPLRCQRTRVSGLKIISVCRQEGHRRYSHTQNKRSLGRKLSRFLSRSAIIANCWRIASISTCNEALLRRISIRVSTRGMSTVFMPVTLAAGRQKSQENQYVGSFW